MAQASRSRGAVVWLRSPRGPARRRPARVRPRGAETMRALFFRNLLRGIALLPPVSLLMMLLASGAGEGSAHVLELVAGSIFISLYAMVPAVTGGLLYLPAVLWAAGRWPRRARAIAVAAAPLVALGTVPWDMLGFLGLWWAVIPVAAGLFFYGATIRLPAPATEGVR